jgi:hypothetical protein
MQTMKGFIDGHLDVYGIGPICKVLPIAPSTHHAHAARQADRRQCSARAARVLRGGLLHDGAPDGTPRPARRDSRQDSAHDVQ